MVLPGKPKIGINGYSTTALVLMNLALHRDDIQLVAINDFFIKIEDWVTKYNDFFGLRQPHLLELTDSKEALRLDGKKITIKFYKIRKKESVPWSKAGADYIVGCERQDAYNVMVAAHLNVGRAKKEVIAAPGKNKHMIVMGVNEEEYNPEINVVPLANCIANCLAPLLKVIHGKFPIAGGYITVAQKALKFGENDILYPTPSIDMVTEAVNKVLPTLKGKFNFEASPDEVDVHAIKLIVQLEKRTTYEKIKRAVKEASDGNLKGILGYTEDEVDRTKFVGDGRSDIFVVKDGGAVRKFSWKSGIFNARAGCIDNGGKMKLVAWYNSSEWGYCSRVIDLILHMASRDVASRDGASPNVPFGKKRGAQY